MGNNWFQKLKTTFAEKRQQRQAEKHLNAILADQIQQIARDSQAGFRMIAGYSKKLIQPARTASA